MARAEMRNRKTSQREPLNLELLGVVAGRGDIGECRCSQEEVNQVVSSREGETTPPTTISNGLDGWSVLRGWIFPTPLESSNALNFWCETGFMRGALLAKNANNMSTYNSPSWIERSLYIYTQVTVFSLVLKQMLSPWGKVEKGQVENCISSTEVGSKYKPRSQHIHTYFRGSSRLPCLIPKRHT